MTYESLRLAAHRAAKGGKGYAVAAKLQVERDRANFNARDADIRAAARAAAGASDSKAKGSAAPTPTRTAPTSAAAPARFTQADVNAAVALAVYNERARISTVFASPASHGRERVCADLLTAPQGFTGANIAKELAHLPTDRDRAAQKAAKGNPQADAVWDKANAAIDARRSPGARAKAAQIVAHQRAMGSPYVKPASQSDAAKERSAGDVWDRAFATL